MTTAAPNEFPHAVNVGARVHQLKVFLGGPPGLPHIEAVPRSRGLKACDYRSEPVRPLRVSRPRIVTEERLGVGEPRSCIYDVELAAPGESRGTGWRLGRSRWLSGCAGGGVSAGVPGAIGGSPRNTRSRLSPSSVSTWISAAAM